MGYGKGESSISHIKCDGSLLFSLPHHCKLASQNTEGFFAIHKIGRLLFLKGTLRTVDLRSCRPMKMCKMRF